MFKKVIVSSFIWCFCSAAFAQINFQEGYVVKLNGDTVKGRINNMVWDQSPDGVQFEGPNGSEVFRPEEILAFSAGAYTVYKSFRVRIDSTGGAGATRSEHQAPTYFQDHIFLRVLVDSRTSLLKFKRGFQTHFFIQLPGQTPVELISHAYEMQVAGQTVQQKGVQYIPQLKTSLSDCKELEVPYDLRFKEELLVLLFTKYNACHNSRSTISGEEPKVKSFGAVGSVGYAQFTGGFTGGAGYSGGLYYEVAYPSRFFKTRWYSEIVYENLGTQTRKTDFGTIHIITNYKIPHPSFVKFVTMIKTRVMYASTGPYVLGGVGRTIAVSAEHFRNDVRTDSYRGSWVLLGGFGLHATKKLATEIRLQAGLGPNSGYFYVGGNLAVCYKLF